MKLYFAPMEGITSFAFRQVHHRFFPGIDRYYTPFLMANQTHAFKRKEIRDILPENNEGLNVIPQILANHADDCLAGIRTIASYGYKEINFNLGCSMPQVANRGRGAGFLGKPDELDAFFEQLFDGLGSDETLREVRLSVKTRIGNSSVQGASALLEIYNRYPICELIVHPRLRTDLYDNVPNLDVFTMFYEDSTHPLSYNGDVFSPEDYDIITRRFPNLEAVMLGRGLITDPSLAAQIKEAPAADAASLEAYLQALREGYLDYMQSDRQVLPHMKEIWYYMAWHYERRASGISGSGTQAGAPGTVGAERNMPETAAELAPQARQELKKLRKSTDWASFSQAQHALLNLWS